MLAGIADILFPPSCVSCGREVGESRLRHVCRRCCCRIQCIESPCCRCCSHPFYGDVLDNDFCDHCEGLQAHFQRGVSAVVARGPARSMIHEIKYHRGVHLAGDMARVSAASARAVQLLRGAVLVPVPLHPRKERERGYNQSVLLAKALARELGEGTRVQNLLKRNVDTQSQTTFDRSARRLNLKNAFALRPSAAITDTLHYVIVDDVFTTGSTLNSCAGVLRGAGCLNLDVFTFGHG